MLAFAENQYSVIGREQIVDLDIGEGWIDYALKRKLIHLQHRGVYSVGRKDLTLRGRWKAALLASPPGAALSHHAAGAFHDLHKNRRAYVDVTVADAGSRDRPGVRVHDVRRLDERDVVEIDGFRVTTPARTLLDLADELRPCDLDRVTARAYEVQLLTVADVDRQLSAPGRRTRKLAQALRVPPCRSRSRAEEEFLLMLKEHGVPEPRHNLWFPEFQVEGDFVWLEYGLVFELDTGGHHRTPHGREKDARKDELLRGINLTVIRRRYGNVEAVRTIQAFLRARGAAV